MPYTVNTELGKPNQRGERKVYLLIITDGKKLPRIDTEVRISTTLKKASESAKNIIGKKRMEIEAKLLQSIDIAGRVSLSNSDLEMISGFWEDRKKDISRSPNRIRAIDAALKAIPDFKIATIDVRKLEEIEKALRDNSKKFGESTIWSYMSRLKAVLNLAIKDNIFKERQISGYKWPAHYEDVPIFLLENEIADFRDALMGIKNESLMQSGYRFLLACYAGYRISDAKRFVPGDFINGDVINLQASKNKRIVSMQIHTRLKEVIDWLEKNPECDLPEQTINLDIKVIARMANITKHIKFHTGRHSFAMMLTRKGFSIEEVAEFLGDDIRAAKTYARLWNDDLNKKIMDRLG